jgi:hypothetical protein
MKKTTSNKLIMAIYNEYMLSGNYAIKPDSKDLKEAERQLYEALATVANGHKSPDYEYLINSIIGAVERDTFVFGFKCGVRFMSECI